MPLDDLDARIRRRHHLLAIRAMPDRNAVPPPKLPRNAPVANIFQPLQQNRPLIVRHHFDFRRGPEFAGHCLARLLRQRLHFHEPLRRNARLHNRFAAVARAHGMRVFGNVVHQTQFFQIANHPRPRHKPLEARIFSRGFVHVRVVRHHVNLGKSVPLAHLKIVGIVRRSDLHHARAEFAVHISVRNDRNLAIHQRQKHFLPDQFLVTFVLRMHRHRRIAQHRLGTRRRHHQILLRRTGHRITNEPQISGALVVHHFQIADGRLAARAPIDHVTPAIDQSLAIQPQKRFQHRAIKPRLQRKSLARPVARSAQANHLLLDDAAALRLPFPHAPLEFLAPQVLALNAFLRQHALHHELRRNPGVIHSRQPQSALAAHAMPAHQHVNLRVLQHVPDVDRAGHVRWRQSDRKTRLLVARHPRIPEFSARNNFSSYQAFAQRSSISCGS